MPRKCYYHHLAQQPDVAKTPFAIPVTVYIPDSKQCPRPPADLVFHPITFQRHACII